MLLSALMRSGGSAGGGDSTAAVLRRLARRVARLQPPSASTSAAAAAVATSSGASSSSSSSDPSSSSPPPPPYQPLPFDPLTVVHKLGIDLLHDPITNAGTAFTLAERERLGLRGLLPPRVTTLRWQMERFLASFDAGEALVPAEALQESVGVTRDMAIKWKRLQALQDRNEALFYMLLIENFERMAPLVYTPSVGWACVNYHLLYRRPRGMFFSSDDRGAFSSMALNWPRNDVQAIVVSDGSRILGLGDLGLNGMGICVGKADLYVAAAGFDPSRVLPVVLDVGTDNPRLLKDPLYMGVRRPRLKGREYYETMDELMGALTRRWPRAVVQFEDFAIDVARPLLDRYRAHHVCFNDDIQGTAAVALGGLYGAMRAQGLPRAALARQRVVVVGAGSAGMGVVETLARGMERSSSSSSSSSSAAAVVAGAGGAAGRFWVLDKDGLITRARADLPAHVAPFARAPPKDAAGNENASEDDDAAALADVEGEPLLSVVRRVRPTVLLGLAGAGKLFTPEVLRAMADGVAAHAGANGLSPRPVVFAMSNPTSRLECTAQEAHDHTGGRAIYASGSPQPDVVVASADGSASAATSFSTSQANNLYVFGGVALGAHLARAPAVTDGMLMAAAEVLPELVADADARAGKVYPPLSEIRAVSAAVAAAVMRAAHADGLVTHSKVLAALGGTDEQLRAWVAQRMWRPKAHTSLAYLPPGVGE